MSLTNLLNDKANTGKGLSKNEDIKPPLAQCYLGLGSNLENELGSPSDHIWQAIKSLKANNAITDVVVSSLYHSIPMGPQDQPDFVNAVVALKTTLIADDLLQLCQQLENEAMRIRKRRWGERSLDVDILLYANRQIHTPSLTVPHTGLFERNFVLIPLLELNPNLTVQGKRLNDIAAAHDWSGLQKLSS